MITFYAGKCSALKSLPFVGQGYCFIFCIQMTVIARWNGWGMVVILSLECSNWNYHYHCGSFLVFLLSLYRNQTKCLQRVSVTLSSLEWKQHQYSVYDQIIVVLHTWACISPRWMHALPRKCSWASDSAGNSYFQHLQCLKQSRSTHMLGLWTQLWNSNYKLR